MLLPPPTSTLFPYTTLFRSALAGAVVFLEEVDHVPASAALRAALRRAWAVHRVHRQAQCRGNGAWMGSRSEEHTSELQSRVDLVCRLLLEKKKKLLAEMNAY